MTFSFKIFSDRTKGSGLTVANKLLHDYQLGRMKHH